jgi:16S rRNA (guanine527-N7)-methyltransferase
MATLSLDEIAALLAPYAEVSAGVLGRLSEYLDLLLKWNARMNLTAIREPGQIVRRHFGESLFAAGQVPACGTLLDFGSGAGFPGIPIQLARPEIRLTLAESQNKKAAFLREAVRVLGLSGSTEVWGGRVAAMPVERVFDVVTLRAVDDTLLALREAEARVVSGGTMVHLTVGMGAADEVRIPGTESGVVRLFRVGPAVPRGTL